ncbi:MULTISPECIES: exodeoxyribonuclease V subunit gamma [unclassified Gilliamella]|uniref:exodeoxyribonuclease V subunit gamma n=1 Tax=unclassified Gilliamella TaxID=2685620 RepID=UPI001305BF06|nr:MULTISPECIES: exodeoxyribonuclease V subunit gamma [unclassified Gilliamella]MWP48959.1 exodeoxyribonuclease V subunit gamma [Gilliamella sp. Lep-s35]MWP69046.1 exodeoxyribonuclease V subunit gamma [Gilliamella sp. Lep-s5]MWP77291.1 exodeoxyribonuclease V subunit gamma [Gilliamella sp. Lep-s21]
MFTIYHSNQVDLLKTLVSELMRRQPLEDVFTPDIVMVQSQGMAQWLQIALADDLGIVANVDFLFPTQFIWQLYQTLLPEAPVENSYNVESMSWRLYYLLPQVIKQPEFSALKHYLDIDKQDRKQYQLAIRIARLFDQYLVYRPDWLAKWEVNQTVAELNNHSDEVWQAELWRKLISISQPYHRANIYQQMLEILLDDNFDRSRLNSLPNRIFIFGITSLPPIYLSLLAALGKHIDVHLMFNNPCKWYWGDIVEKQLSDILNTPDQIPNPLLTSWGKLGRDNLFLLQEFNDKQDIDVFVDQNRDCLLHAIQQDILELYPIVDAQKPIELADKSLSFHACHSEQREVEVLYDYLLSVFDEDPTLELRDCIVMVSDIDKYVPYIRAVFGNAYGKRYLPFTISDQKARNIDPIVQGFFTILNFPQSRFTAEELFNLLEIPAISEKFAISESQLTLLRTWIVESGIRFGLENAHSWLFGLERLLLGYTMNSEQGGWQQILPYDGATGLDAELIGKLAEFVSVVKKWLSILSEEKPLIEWQSCGFELMNDFFASNLQRESILLMIEDEWQKLINSGMVANYTDNISIIILHDAMQSRLEQNHLAHRFLIGKINFCTMMPMRSIPFKVVCLLGMNDGDYPRTSLPLDFDLIAQHPRRGDRSRRNDDRYLFLEAILSAQNQLYISYIGRDIKDDSERYPSILVDELWEYIAQYYNISVKQVDNIINNLDCLRINHTRTPFNPLNFLQNPKSYADEWLPAALQQGKNQDFISEIPAISVDNISLDELKRFYQHSIRLFLQKRFNFYMNYLDDTLPDAENFNFDSLQRYQLNLQILNQLITKEPQQKDDLYQQLALTGDLPDGAFGQIIYHEQNETMQSLADKICQERLVMTTQEVNLTISSNDQHYQLQGWLTHIQDDGILTWRPSKLSIRDGISLWIDHLVYCILSPNKIDSQSRMYGREDNEWRFSHLNADQALAILTNLVEGYLQGINEPLLMPLKSSWSWLIAAYDQKTGKIIASDRAINQLLNSWQGGFNQSAECDSYYTRLYPELTDKLIEQIIFAAERFLLPILLHQKAVN